VEYKDICLENLSRRQAPDITMDALHLTTAHSSTDTRIFNKEASSLAEAGFDVGIVAHDSPEGPRNGVEFYSLGTATSRIERWQSIRNVITIATEVDASVYHFHDPELLPVGVYLSYATDGAVVYDVHENFSHVASMRSWIPNWARYGLSTGIPFAERTAARRFDAIVSVTDWIGEQFRDVARNFQTVHNFPKTVSMPSVNRTIETTADCTLCFVGGLEDARGIHEMLDLLRQLVEDGVDAELWALGSWMPDTDREAAEQFIKTHELSDRVTFPGYLDYEEMFRYLESADVGLALYDVEHCKFAIPTKFFEYLYAGLPVVTTPVAAVSDFLPPEYRYVVPEGDTKGAAMAVQRALNANHDRTRMQQIVEEQYSWEQEAEKLISLYEELLY
jgi:glycosyltransferase involved in cell wall biosynthesis